MRKRWSFVFLMAALPAFPAFPQQFIADHTVATEAVLRGIPESYLNQARNELVVAYQHTSHGTHVAYGIYGLQDFKTGDELLFGISTSREPGKLDFRDNALEDYAPSGVIGVDLSADETAFIQTTRNFLDAAENAAVNVVMWSWCDITNHNVAGNYLPGMNSLISEYGPEGTKIGTGAGQRANAVTFVFMTGHAVLNANTGPLQPASQATLIRNYCNNHGYYCLDYYGIDSHDMDGNYYQDAGDDGNSATYGGNFYQDWQDAGTLGVDYFENKTAPGGSVAYGAHTTQHITSNRKGFAFWWILARIAGWNGSTGPVPVSSIHLNPDGGITSIETGETLQFTANVLPSDASDKTVAWSVVDGSGHATISVTGLLTAVGEGTVNVLATASDGSGISGSMQITISDPVVPVSAITVIAAGGVSEISTGETLQLSATVLPSDASNKSVTWSVVNQSGQATIGGSGLLTALSPGIVNVVATASDGSGISGNMQLTISAPDIPVASVSVSAAGGVSEISTGETLQLSAAVLPSNASNKSVTWSVVNQTGQATIGGSGLLTALSPGIVNAVATASDGSGVSGSMQITISAPDIPLTSIEVISEGGVSEIITGETLQFTAAVLPSNASSKSVTWSVMNQTGQAVITGTGLLTAVSPGTVLVQATARDGTSISGSMLISITNTEVLISSLVVSAEGHRTSLHVGDTLRCTAEVVPYLASYKRILWSVSNQTGMAVVSQVGRLTASKAGLVEVQAAALDGSGVTGRLQITVVDTVVRVDSVRIVQLQGLTTLMAGESLQFTAEVLPEEAKMKQVLWSVSNFDGEAIMDENGVLSGIIAGTVRIFAHATDQSGVSDSMDITITDPVLAESIQVGTSGGITRIPEGGTLQCTVDFIPGETTIRKVLWTVHEITGSAYITQEGMLMAVSAGHVGVVATTSDCTGLRDTLVIEIFETVTGEQDIGLPQMKVYPNPGKGTFYLDAGTLVLGLIEVLSPQGQTILQIKPDRAVSLVPLDLHGVTPGSYYIRARWEHGICTKKIIIY